MDNYKKLPDKKGIVRQRLSFYPGRDAFIFLVQCLAVSSYRK